MRLFQVAKPQKSKGVPPSIPVAKESSSSKTVKSDAPAVLPFKRMEPVKVRAEVYFTVLEHNVVCTFILKIMCFYTKFDSSPTTDIMQTNKIYKGLPFPLLMHNIIPTVCDK